MPNLIRWLGKHRWTGLQAFIRWLVPKDLWVVLLTGLGAYLAYHQWEVEKPSVANAVAFRVVDMIQERPDKGDVTSSAPNRLRQTWRIVLLNGGARQIAMYRMVPVVSYGPEKSYRSVMRWSDDVQAAFPVSTLEGGKAEVIDFPVDIPDGLVSDATLPLTNGIGPTGSTHKVAAHLCIETIASNGIPLQFKQQIAWLYFGEGNKYLGFRAVSDTLDLQPTKPTDQTNCVGTAVKN